MEIINAGYNYRHPAGFCINRPYGSGDYLLLVIRSEAFMHLNGERMIVPPNSVVIFKKGTPQLYGTTRYEYVNDWIHFEISEAEESFVSSLGVPFDAVLPLREVSEFSGFIKNVFVERYSQNPQKEATMQRYFELLLLKLSEKINKQRPEYDHPYYDHFCTLRNDIHLAPQNNWSIDEICKRMNLSRSHVQHLYKAFFGTSITADIQSSRVEHAKYLLSATNMTVCGIALSCGYNNDTHFMRIFKKRTNMTPSEFRDQFQVYPKM